MTPELRRLALFLAALLLLAGCESVAKGVTGAVLESSESREDARQCHIEGPAEPALGQMLETQDGSSDAERRELKVLMVHGIGRHAPGYSGRLVQHLMPALDLSTKSNVRKEIVLREPSVSDLPVGRLSVDLYMNEDRSRRLVFYELTWSDVFDEERKTLEFDNSKEHTFRRTALNGFIKSFFNDRVPDAFIYLSDARERVFASVQQSVCWMTSADWDGLPNQADERCNPENEARADFAREDDFAFITHSLGSRIVIDVLQDETGAVQRVEGETSALLEEAYRGREIPVFMMANQLPLLALSIDPPSVQDQTAEYCDPAGALYGERAIEQLTIFAFSDPNDLLSYPIPPNLARRYVDSRLCPSVINITVNVARLVNLFGISEVANPGAAHSDYDHDDRVIEIMAHGVGQPASALDFEEQCSWFETVEGG